MNLIYLKIISFILIKMSQNTQISNSESNIKISKDIDSHYQFVLTCKCGQFHELEMIFQKEHLIIFPCISIKLEELKKTKEIRKKCDYCEIEINLENDYCSIDKSDTLFICENCYQNEKYKNFPLNEENFEKISTIFRKNDEDALRKRIRHKFINFITKNNISNKTNFYKTNLSKIKLLQNFIEYLCYLKKLYHKKNIIYKIIMNFVEYTEHLIDIASNNIQIYDLYHFNKETLIYSYLIKENDKFYLSDFKSKYSGLIEKCKQKRYLSKEMLKYICTKYKEKNSIIENNILNIENKYLKEIEEINIKNEVFSKASTVSINYLTISSIFSEINNELQIIKLKTRLTKLDGEIFIDKYLNSYLNIPGEFLSLRKCSSIILNKLIEKNYEKLNFNQPNRRIVHLTLDFINKLRNKLNKDKKFKIDYSIRIKLNALEEMLLGYIQGDKKGKPVNDLIPPLIIFNEEEKDLLSFILMDNTYDAPKKIKVANSKDDDLNFIINFFFEIKEKTNKTIHINKQENLQFYSLSKKLEDLPKKNEDDDLNQGLEKIIKTLKMELKNDEVSYSTLINLMLTSDNKDFFELENKLDYLLSLIDVKYDKLCDIKKEYESYKEILDKLPEKLNKIMCVSKFKINEKKYQKFINKYSIKTNSKKIFEYLDNMIEYIMPVKKLDGNEEEEKNKNDSINNYNKRDKYTINIVEKYEKKEEELRSNIIELFNKDKKFISYFSNYYWIKLNNYVKKNKEIFMNKIQSLIEKKENEYLLFLKLKKMKNIFNELKMCHFIIDKYFKNFVDKQSKEYIPSKKKKIDENVVEEQVITNFNFFIKKLKEYIGDVNEKVELTEDEPGEFVLKLFLKKIGFNIS